MNVLIVIVVAIIAFAIISSVCEWIIDNIVPIIILIACIAGCIFVPRLAIPIIAVGLVIFYIQNKHSKRNQLRNKTQSVEIVETKATLPIEEKNADDQDVTKRESIPDDVKEIIEKGREYICSLRSYNEAIPHRKVSDQLYEMEETLRTIVSEIESHPEKAPEAKKLFSYYLPTIDKIMSKYAYYEKREISDEYANETKEEIQKNIEMMNKALKEFQNKLFQDDNNDISVEISVMKKMMEQDGIVV